MSGESERRARRQRRAELAEEWAPVPRREFVALQRKVDHLERLVKALRPPANGRGDGLRVLSADESNRTSLSNELDDSGRPTDVRSEPSESNRTEERQR